MNNKNFSIIISASFAYVCLLVIGVFIIQQINKQAQEIISIKKNIRSIEKVSTSFKSKIAQVQEYNNRFDNLGLNIVDEGEPREFTRALQEYANKSNVTIKADLNYADNVKEKAIFFRISAIGQYEKVMYFLRLVERSSWLTEVYNISMMRNSDGQVTLSFDLKAYTKQYGI